MYFLLPPTGIEPPTCCKQLIVQLMKEMRANYLHQDWEDQIRNLILTSTLTSSKTSFWNWSQKLLKLNCLLRGTTSVFDDAALRNHLEAHLDDELWARLKHNEARKDKSLKTWIAAVCLIDEARTIETKRHRELIEETLDRQAKRQNTRTDTLRGPSHRGNTSQSGTNSNPSSSTTNFVKLPPLTDSERTLLNEHEGCTKCRRFYTDHRSQSCPNGFPLGKGYKTLTLTDALSAKKGKAVAKLSAKPVAATSTAFEAVDSDDEISATAAILPDSPSEYTSDSDEDWDVSRREVSQPSLHSKHLIWNCQIHSLTDDFPTKTHVLSETLPLFIRLCMDISRR
jgi:hypothetical protein